MSLWRFTGVAVLFFTVLARLSLPSIDAPFPFDYVEAFPGGIVATFIAWCFAYRIPTERRGEWKIYAGPLVAGCIFLLLIAWGQHYGEQAHG